MTYPCRFQAILPFPWRETGAFSRKALRASSFHRAVSCLDRKRKKAATLLYGFFRAVDDAADRLTEPEARCALAFWLAECRRMEKGAARHPLGRALLPVLSEYGVSPLVLAEMVRGCGMDLTGEMQRPSWPVYLTYCFRVATCPGLALLPVTGCRDPEAERCARLLGVAMQSVNILRDVPKDLADGRIYLPVDVLKTHGLEHLSAKELLSNKQGTAMAMQDLSVLADRYFNNGLRLIRRRRGEYRVVDEMVSAYRRVQLRTLKQAQQKREA